MTPTKLEQYFQKPHFYWPLLIAIAAATPLTFAPYYHFWLMPLLFGAFIRLIELRPKIAVRSAYLFGLVSYSLQFYWIHTALHDISGLPNLYALPLTLLLPAFLAIYPAACFWLWEKFNLPRWLSIGFILPILWTSLEYIRARALTGFGWGALGYSQIADGSPLAGFAPIGGIQLVTLATTLLSAWLVLVCNNTALKQRLIFACAAIALLVAGNTARHTTFTHSDGQKTRVALLQGNIAQGLKWSESQVIPTIQRYYNMVAASHADIVITPETAIPVFLQSLPEGLIAQFANQAERNGSALAIGIAQYTSDGKGYQNAVINLANYNPEAPDNIPYYAKNHLVPFGEYKPFPALTNPLYQMMNMPLADFQRGGIGQKPFAMKNQKVAFNICYEDGFGDELIQSAKESTLLANISNMAWYGSSNAMFQQLQQSQARALELGRYIVRATNTGATAIINPQGHVVAEAKPDIQATLTGEVEGYTGNTPYMKLGGSLKLQLLLILTLLGCYAYSRKRATIKP